MLQNSKIMRCSMHKDNTNTPIVKSLKVWFSYIDKLTSGNS